jgi:cellulose synthase operon protein C
MTRRRCAPLLLVAMLFAVGAAACDAQNQAARASGANTAAALYQRGDYAQAIVEAERGLRAAVVSPSDAMVYVRALTDVGRPAQALERVAALTGIRSQPQVAPAIAVALESIGNVGDAADAWIIALRSADSLRAKVELIRLDEQLRLARAPAAPDSASVRLMRLVAQVNARGGPRTASEFHAVAIASQQLGRTDPQRFKDALRLYDRAIALEPTNTEALVGLSELFLEKYNHGDARTTLQKALAINPRHPRALAALARLNAAESRRAPRDPLLQLLAVNPASTDAHVLLAYRLIDAELYDVAVLEARKGLVTDSTAPAPWVAIAAARWLARDTSSYRAALDRAHLRLARSAAAEVELAEVSARNRLYADAVRFARAGVARDSLDSRAQALLGINLLRTGDIAAGRATLERAFALDPFDVRVKNTLDLLDSYAKARTVTTEHFDLVLESGDADVMALYASPLAEEAYAALTTRYGFTPSGRVRVEFFRSHADFSVRAVGLAGLGALGVAFGNVLAIDLPPARSRGEFNWAAVLWHEFAHTITLGMTDNRVPRWVSEGLSVLEERRARREWGGGATPALIAAYGAGRLRPVSRLNDGFVHPRYGQEVILSYALSAYVFEMLEERAGIAGIRSLLQGYRQGGDTPELMQRVYGMNAAALDAAFDTWFRAKFAREFSAVRSQIRVTAEGDTITELAGPLREALAAAASAMQAKQWPQVIQSAQRAVTLFPSYVDPGSGYHFLASAHEALNDSAGARASLAEIAALNGEAVDQNITLASMLEAARDSSAAITALERATLADPFDPTPQTKLAQLAFAGKKWPAAVRARRAVLALGPSDRADAYYRLAQALAASGDVAAAKREVLRALDLAPNFEAAQDLLLSLRSTGTPK